MAGASISAGAVIRSGMLDVFLALTPLPSLLPSCGWSNKPSALGRKDGLRAVSGAAGHSSPLEHGSVTTTDKGLP